MNVASLELCQELYELSAWGKSAFPYHIHDGLQKYFTYSDGSNTPYIVDGTAYSLTDDEKAGEHIPAYDLGYLRVQLVENQNPKALFGDNLSEAVKYTERVKRALLRGEDDTAKLAIQLFKQGILKRSSSK